MAQEFRLPDIGEGLTEAEVIQWLVEVGDPVGVDQPLAELETDYISRLLEEFGGHRARVAQRLGISERTLYRKLKKP